MLSHETEYRVIYGDTDQMGIAYYANYLRWFEIGRTELLRAWQMPYQRLESEEGIWLPVSEVSCKYLAPARYDDLVIIQAELDPRIKGSMKIDYRIVNHDRKVVHATGYTRHAFMNREGRVTRPPAFIRELIANLSRQGHA